MPNRPVTILAWNILHGGGPKRAPRIVLELLGHAPDVVLLSEARAAFAGQIAGVLHDHGLRYHQTSDPQGRQNGLMLASRWPIRSPGGASHAAPPDPVRVRWLDADLPDLGLRVTGVHIHDTHLGDAASVGRNALYWKHLLDSARDSKGAPRIFVGDFNTARRGVDSGGGTRRDPAEVSMGKLESMGYREAYRTLHPGAQDWTWRSHTGTGFRLDQAFVSGALSGSIESVSYPPTPFEQRLSDHKPLVLKVDLGRGGDEAAA